jgi:myosin heavy subunit
MSEANPPSSDPSQNQTSSSSNWDISANADPTNATDEIAENQEDWQDWQTVDFPNALSVDAIDRQSLYSSDEAPLIDWLAQATPNPSAAQLWSTGASNSTEPPEIADLIALIQELNQCNDVLLDRVSQLEESLERTQKDQTLANGQPQVSTASQTVSSQTNQTLIAAQAEIAKLSNDLEFAQQTNQRQQILIETLTGQLESSQERVAQLERECALTQQRYSEQTHQLTQSEKACRDLHARLQRQQRYTLQFKAALEKCLEVPPPNYEAKEQVVEAIAHSSPDKRDTFTPQSFLPRAKQIQPWSAQPQFLSELSNLNVDDLENLDEAQLTPKAQVETKHQNTHQFHPSAAASLDLPTVLASIIHPDQATSDASAVELTAEPSTPSEATTPKVEPQPLSYDLKKSAGWWHEATSQLQSASLAPKSPHANQTRSETQSVEDLPASSEVPTEIGFSDSQPSNSVSSEKSLPPLNDAEDALWQDLARLIDVSTDDVVKASVSDDFDSFEAIAPSTPADSQPASSDNSPQPPSQPQSFDLKQQIAQGVSLAQLLLSSSQSAATEQPAPEISDESSESEQKVPAFAANSNWPSPLVYPLRSSKKIESLAAVKLPTFPR